MSFGSQLFSNYYIMPYKIKKVKGGFVVTDGKKNFSNKPLTKEMAKKQQLAITIPMAKKFDKPIETFWV